MEVDTQLKLIDDLVFDELYSPIQYYWRIVSNLYRGEIQKWPQPTLFDWFYKIIFAAFLKWNPVSVYIWLTHQSKALIFYFDMKKILNQNFQNFVENRQSNIRVFKFSVCLHTHSNFQNMKFRLSVFHKILKFLVQNFFHVKIENQSFRLMG